MFKKFLSSLILTVVVSETLTLTTYAQDYVPGRAKFDIDKVTCRELLLMDGEEQGYTLLFYHGIMSGKKN